MIETKSNQDPEVRLWINANEETLIQQSRSFSVPLLKLDDRFRTPVMVQYNLNKTIDTIEDSTALEVEEKTGLIKAFCEHIEENTWSPQIKEQMLQITPPDESFVFSNYEHTISLYNTLSKEEKALSKRWTLEMAEGMCHYLKRVIHTPKDLNGYCYYVAGTVGSYLTELLQLKGANVTEETFEKLKERAVSFGTFLQKLNIIRDFIEDKTTRNRTFWPRIYFEQEKDLLKILNKMLDETFKNDLPGAIDYNTYLPPGNESFEYFIRFILASGIEYWKMLKDNKSVLSNATVKLPKTFITNLYAKLAALDSKQFADYCNKYHTLRL
jgi:farnesyl-diphosphate farnesyltransferase